MKTSSPKGVDQIRDVLADLDARINAKESFVERVGLIPFAAGAMAMFVILVVWWVFHL